MTIEQKAREIVSKMLRSMGAEYFGRADEVENGYCDNTLAVKAARLGIIEGLEMAAKVAEEWRDENKQSAAEARKQGNRQFASELDGAATECNAIAGAIRALLEESKG